LALRLEQFARHANVQQLVCLDEQLSDATMEHSTDNSIGTTRIWQQLPHGNPPKAMQWKSAVAGVFGSHVRFLKNFLLVGLACSTLILATAFFLRPRNSSQDQGLPVVPSPGPTESPKLPLKPLVWHA